MHENIYILYIWYLWYWYIYSFWAYLWNIPTHYPSHTHTHTHTHTLFHGRQSQVYLYYTLYLCLKGLHGATSKWDRTAPRGALTLERAKKRSQKFPKNTPWERDEAATGSATSARGRRRGRINCRCRLAGGISQRRSELAVRLAGKKTEEEL